uniref:Uncharacterized protein n=1 Tax=Oryza glumipatula TaxID=40148 RepID=A0A0D9YAN5_9ORYZ
MACGIGRWSRAAAVGVNRHSGQARSPPGCPPLTLTISTEAATGEAKGWRSWAMRCSFITGPHRHRKWEGRVEGNKNYKLKWIKIGFIIGVFRRFPLGKSCVLSSSPSD